MSIPNHIEHLKASIHSVDWETAKNASDELATIGGKEVVDFLISLLNQSNAKLRNVAALGLREMRDNCAIEPLLNAINKKGNENNRGTMVYALQTSDCSQKLPEIFDLLFYGNFEVRMMASTILEEQIFEFTRQDLHNIQCKWEDLQEHPEKCPGFNAEVKDLIQDFVADYLAYLNQ